MHTCDGRLSGNSRFGEEWRGALLYAGDRRDEVECRKRDVEAFLERDTRGETSRTVSPV